MQHVEICNEVYTLRHNIVIMKYYTKQYDLLSWVKDLLDFRCCVFEFGYQCWCSICAFYVFLELSLKLLTQVLT